MKDLGDTMFTVTKRLEVSASHQLKLDYPSKCQIYMDIIGLLLSMLVLKN